MATRAPWPNFLDRPVPARFGVGMDYGLTKRTGATWRHRVIGTLWGMDAYFRMLSTAALTAWGIGGSLDANSDGTIIRFVDYADPNNRIIPWGSGSWNPPGFLDGQKYVNRFGVQGINSHGEAIEFSGFQNTPMTPKQWVSGIMLMAAIRHDAGMSYDQELWDMQHREATTPAVKDCPFPAHYNDFNCTHQRLAEYMRFWETGKDFENTFHTAGGTVTLPVEGGGGSITPPAAPIYVGLPKSVRLKVTASRANLRQYAYVPKSPEQDNTKQSRTFGDIIGVRGFYLGQVIQNDPVWFVTSGTLGLRVHASAFYGAPNFPEQAERYSK